MTDHPELVKQYVAQYPDGPTAKAFEAFRVWFAENYPGPHTIISNPHWHAGRIFRRIAELLDLARSAVPHETPDDGAYHVRIVHLDKRLGVEEHWCNLAKVQRFLNGYYANVQPGDEITVCVPIAGSQPTGRGASDG